jgi:hypothetical protein
MLSCSLPVTQVLNADDSAALGEAKVVFDEASFRFALNGQCGVASLALSALICRTFC